MTLIFILELDHFTIQELPHLMELGKTGSVACLHHQHLQHHQRKKNKKSVLKVFNVEGELYQFETANKKKNKLERSICFYKYCEIMC